MERAFGEPYLGDPGVPHSGPDGFAGILWGVGLFTVYAIFDPYYWQKANTYSWHDVAICHETYKWRQARKKKQLADPDWNKLPRKVRDCYYQGWPYFMI